MGFVLFHVLLFEYRTNKEYTSTTTTTTQPKQARKMVHFFFNLNFLYPQTSDSIFITKKKENDKNNCTIHDYYSSMSHREMLQIKLLIKYKITNKQRRFQIIYTINQSIHVHRACNNKKKNKLKIAC